MLPPAGWQPDASFPAPPAGWIYYRNADGVPVDAPAGAWRPPAFASVVSAVPAVTHAPVQTRGKRPLLLVLSGALVVALVAVGAFVLWPRSPQLSTEQFAKLAAAPTIAGWSTKGWDPYRDEPMDFSDWTDPAPLPACEAGRSHAQSSLLRSQRGGFVDGDSVGGLEVQLWADRDALDAGGALDYSCNQELGGVPASTRGDRVSWDEWKIVDREGYVGEFQSVSGGGVHGFYVRVANVRLNWVCFDGKSACASEAELDRMASRFAKEVAAVDR